jgi:hypothetical protein
MKRGPGKRGAHLRPSVKFSETMASKALNAASYSDSSERTHCVHIISEAGDKCVVGSWVFARSPFDVGVRFSVQLQISSQHCITERYSYW